MTSPEKTIANAAHLDYHYGSEMPVGSNDRWLYEHKKESFIAGACCQKKISERDMHLNMQYYMEYCQANRYITPADWIRDKKHF